MESGRSPTGSACTCPTPECIVEAEPEGPGHESVDKRVDTTEIKYLLEERNKMSYSVIMLSDYRQIRPENYNLVSLQCRR